jgi:hypothetical protein
VTNFAEFEKRLGALMRGEGEEFDRLALQLFRLQYDHVATYRALCDSQSARPQSIQSWTQIPVVPTSAFKELEFTSIPAGERTTVFCSSGTTQQRPSRHFHHARSLAIYESSLLTWAKQHLPLQDATLIFLTPDAAQAPHSSLVHMFHAISRHKEVRRATFVGATDSDGTWQIDSDRAIALLKACESTNEPVGVVGTAFNFVHLLDALDAEGLRLSLPLRSWALETGGYKGRSRTMPKSELHALIGGLFGLRLDRIITEYGMCELSSQAYDTSLVQFQNSDRVFRFPPWARAMVISPETGREVDDGDIGLLRACDLANVYSVMAIETQDLARRRGSDFELMGRAELAEARGCSLVTQ